MKHMFSVVHKQGKINTLCMKTLDEGDPIYTDNTRIVDCPTCLDQMKYLRARGLMDKESHHGLWMLLIAFALGFMILVAHMKGLK